MGRIRKDVYLYCCNEAIIKTRVMNKAQLKLEVEKLAKEMDVDFITAAQSMQTAALMMANEKLIKVLSELKIESLGL